MARSAAASPAPAPASRQRAAPLRAWPPSSRRACSRCARRGAPGSGAPPRRPRQSPRSKSATRACFATSTSGMRVETTGSPAARYSRTLCGFALRVTSLRGNGLMATSNALAYPGRSANGFRPRRWTLGKGGEAGEVHRHVAQEDHGSGGEMLRDVDHEIEVEPALRHQPEVADDGPREALHRLRHGRLGRERLAEERPLAAPSRRGPAKAPQRRRRLGRRRLGTRRLGRRGLGRRKARAEQVRPEQAQSVHASVDGSYLSSS